MTTMTMIVVRPTGRSRGPVDHVLTTTREIDEPAFHSAATLVYNWLADVPSPRTRPRTVT